MSVKKANYFTLDGEPLTEAEALDFKWRHALGCPHVRSDVYAG